MNNFNDNKDNSQDTDEHSGRSYYSDEENYPGNKHNSEDESVIKNLYKKNYKNTSEDRKRRTRKRESSYKPKETKLKPNAKSKSEFNFIAKFASDNLKEATDAINKNTPPLKPYG